MFSVVKTKQKASYGGSSILSKFVATFGHIRSHLNNHGHWCQSLCQVEKKTCIPNLKWFKSISLDEWDISIGESIERRGGGGNMKGLSLLKRQGRSMWHNFHSFVKQFINQGPRVSTTNPPCRFYSLYATVLKGQYEVDVKVAPTHKVIMN